MARRDLFAALLPLALAVTVVTTGSAHVTLVGVRYELERFHFHAPSEHGFAGRSDPLETHFVHRGAEGGLLVIGVPLRAGVPSTVDKPLAHPSRSAARTSGSPTWTSPRCCPPATPRSGTTGR